MDSDFLLYRMALKHKHTPETFREMRNQEVSYALRQQTRMQLKWIGLAFAGMLSVVLQDAHVADKLVSEWSGNTFTRPNPAIATSLLETPMEETHLALRAVVTPGIDTIVVDILLNTAITESLSVYFVDNQGRVMSKQVLLAKGSKIMHSEFLAHQVPKHAVFVNALGNKVGQVAL